MTTGTKRPDPWKMPWRDLTWGERFEMVAVWLIMTAFGIGVTIGAIILLDSAVDNISQYKSERNSCLQRATNGLEIEECR